MALIAESCCEIGYRKPVNQDAVICDVEQGLFAAIDGVSRCSNGELAAIILKLHLRATCTGTPDSATLHEAYLEAHREMRQQIDDGLARSLQTVGTAIWVDPANGRGYLAHVGDTRALSRRDTCFVRHTVDHTTTALLDDEEARKYRSYLTRAVGSDQFACHGPVIKPFAMEPGVLYLLASDGLHHFVLLDRVAQVVLPDDPVDKAVRCAYHIAMDGQRERGHGDNVTIVAMRYVP